ncbi:hypothetical protein NA57DRAFT_47000 [Rhizodiscina lignyota]|uniref:endo-1,3(4)-beta-glucanase n=1 Tax=Rhizodiscina lignyota TaxID=1504668 RepID=A0A9P4M251_9PEZI|nr:hypothetical protein NA57DRAFT_47000 [Rhizodiscina lignyota]
MSSSTFGALLCSVILSFSTTLVNAGHYSLTQDYSGAKFFEGFNFSTIPDPTQGFVTYIDQSAANSTGLAGMLTVNGSETGAVYLGVDSTTKLSTSGPGRNSHRAQTNQTWNHALVIADISHTPGGICGTWPAFWMLGTSSEWPNAGEIDIIEGVNSQNFNAMTLHTNAGVEVQNNTNLFKGTLTTSDCNVADPNQPTNQGCNIADSPNADSFGKVFNANGGGVFATEWTSDFIKIWFFNRTHIPANVLSSSPSPSSSWGTPNALFQPANNTIDSHFSDLQLIFDTTMCGQWAGQAWTTDAECSKLAPTCDQYVAENPAAFKDAYWAINSLKVFQDQGAPAYGSGNGTQGR